MPDPTTDIEALSAFLLGQPVIGARYHAALTALVAERDSLKQRVAELEESTSILRWRVTTMLAEQRPAASDLRERLVCAALTGLCADPSFDGIVVRSAIAFADEALADMRKGDSDAK